MSENRSQAFVVVHPFGVYVKGDIITDANVVASLRAKHQMKFIVPTQLLSRALEATTTLENG